MRETLPPLPDGVLLTEHFDHAIVKLPRVYPTLRWQEVLMLGALGSLMLMLRYGVVLDPIRALVWLGLVLTIPVVLGWRLRRQSAPYVELTITDQAVMLRMLRPNVEVLLTRDEIARLEVRDGGLVVHTAAEETVTMLAGRPAEQTAWLMALLDQLSRTDGSGGRAAIPSGLAELEHRLR